MKIRIKIISIMMIIIIMITIGISCYGIETTTVQTITYQESVENISNPDRGFYDPIGIACKPVGMDRDKTIPHANGFLHLRLGLRDFSAKGNLDKDYDITQETLEILDLYMEQIRQAGGNAIIRFAYDNFNGIADIEPEIEQIEKHIAQLKPFFVNNADVITSVESGFLGPYGEQHSSSIVTNENIKRVVDALLEAVPEERTISVRKPGWYCAASGVAIENIDKNITTKQDRYYRVGIFNDGYLGSASDLGTYKNRKKEIEWLSYQATHTVFGGEAVKVNSIHDVDENGNLYNSPEHIEQEMFLTHTTYLNEYWNDKLIGEWKNTLYTGQDPLYQGKTAFEYVQNHLGYRFVLKEAKIPSRIETEATLSMKVTIENVGAGNVVNPKDMYILLKNSQKEYAVLLSEDITTLQSRESKEIKINIVIPEQVEVADYDVYLKVVNQGETVKSNKRCIQFANTSVWDNELAANKIGSIKVIEKRPEEVKNEIKDTNTENTINEVANTTENTIYTNQEMQNSIVNDTNQEIDTPNHTNQQENTIVTGNIISGGNKAEEVEQDSIAPGRIPQTGEKGKNLIFYGMVICIVAGIIMLIRYIDKK